MKEPNTLHLRVSADDRPEVSRRSRRARGAAITAGVLLLVVLFNVLFSVVADRFMWQLDTTVTHDRSEDSVTLYTPTDNYIQWVREQIIPSVDQLNAERAATGEDPLTINVKFCADKDRIYGSDEMRLLQYSVAALQKEFPHHVKVSYIDIEENPSAVQQYKATSASRIYPHQIIFEFGTEYRVRSYDSFFLTSSQTSTDYWAYNGEQQITSLLLSLTRAISPVAAFITNHGENVENVDAFRALVKSAGYEVVNIDLSRDPIPEHCRLLICNDPQTDFLGLGNSAFVGAENEQSEIAKLDAFLDNACSFMLFVDNDTPHLPVLEEYLEEWGVTVTRGKLADGTLENYTIRDKTQKLDKDGYTLLADYVTTGVGGKLTSPMRNVASPATVIFPNATSISMSNSYFTRYEAENTSTGTPAFTYGSYERNGVSRYFNDVFLSGVNSVAEVGGEQYEVTTQLNRFRLMTLSVESRTIKETTYLSVSDPSHVAVFGSTEFISDTLLNSASYGNADVLSATLLTMGHEVEPANLNFKVFKNYEIDTETYEPDANSFVAATIILIVAPILLSAVVGTVIGIKRKYR